MSARIRDHLRSNIIGYVALFLALTGGVAWASHPGGANTITSGDIVNGEVKTGDIGDFEVKAADVAPDSLGGNKIVDRSVKNADLSIGASSSNTIADGGIQGIDVRNNTLTGTQIDEGTLFNDDSLTGADIDESTLAGVPSAPTGPAGGDLDGMYPDPVIADAAVTIPKLGFDPATQAELDDHAGSAAHDFRYWKLDGNSAIEPGQFLGTTDNQPLNLRVNNARGLRLEPASDGTNQSPNVIGGTADNSVSSGVHSATIAGGGRSAAGNPSTGNRVTDDFGTVGGGGANRAGDGAGTVSDQRWATVGGGRENTASGSVATVGGGDQNTASAFYATVPGGLQNTAQGPYSLAAGRRAQANHQGAFVWGDSSAFDFASTAPNQFNVRSTGGARLVSGIDGAGNPASGLELLAGTSGWSTLVNGQPFDIRVNNSRGLRVEPASDGTNQSPNVIGGIADNAVTSGAFAATIAGGGRGTAGNPASANEVTDNYGTIGGGSENQAGDAGGTVGDRQSATVAGGNSNTASGERATVGGGGSNTASGPNATVGGGFANTASGAAATVSGGSPNSATEFLATVAGGGFNHATASSATVGGGQSNTASGVLATVPGGLSNIAAGDTSFIAGSNALNFDAAHDGVFMFSDSQPFAFFSTAANEFAVRSTGGARFVSAIDAATGAPTAGVTLAPGAGSWSDLSDEDSKTAISPISVREVLDRVAELPVSTWSYKAQGADVRHIGPMAQDFAAAFEVGEDERHIATVDANGVALAAIKGLNQKVERLQRKVAALTH